MIKRLMKRKSFLFPLLVLVLFSACVMVGAHYIAEAESTARINLGARLKSPAERPPLGTDPSGRDMLGQLIIGTRNSLLIALAITVLSTAFGSLFGLISGTFGGFVDLALMRLLDFVAMLPRMMLVIVLIPLVPSYNAITLTLMLGAIGWMRDARIVRGKALLYRDASWVQAARSMGIPRRVIIPRHVLPQITPAIIANFTIGLAGNIGVESGLSFLGFGLPFSTPSLGTLLSYAQTPENLQQRGWLWLPALLIIFIIMILIHCIGQAIIREMNENGT
ncbi:MAG: ABC transporter permease [Oscillospiraceae bacterium]|jgi:peptide/nickel transport system permease protein|nr:ABC transporter permease [Oscillospiraceae bacterium]